MIYIWNILFIIFYSNLYLYRHTKETRKFDEFFLFICINIQNQSIFFSMIAHHHHFLLIFFHWSKYINKKENNYFIYSISNSASNIELSLTSLVTRHINLICFYIFLLLLIIYFTVYSYNMLRFFFFSFKYNALISN